MAGGEATGHLLDSDPRLLAKLGGLDLVTDLDVVVLPETDTGLEVGTDLGDVVLEPAQRLDGEVVPHHHAVADDARLGVARDRSGADDDTGDVAELGGAEHLADLGDTRLDLFELGLEHALERVLDVLEGGVDDRVEPDVHTLAGGTLAGLRVRPHIEADDDGVVDGGEVDVALRDRTHTAVDDAQLHRLVHVDLEHRLLECLDGTGDVTLDDEDERVDLALFESAGKVIERDALAVLRQRGVALDGLAVLGALPSRAVLLGDEEGVAGTRDAREALHLDRPGRVRLGDGLAVLVHHRPDAAVGRARDDRIADAQRSGLDEHGRDGAAALVQLRLDGDTARVLVGVRTEVESRIRRQQHRVEELLDAGAGE